MQRIWSEIWLFYREMLDWVVQMYNLWRQSLRLRLAIMLADMKQRAFNRQYYVLSMVLPSGSERMVAVTRDDVARLKRKKWLPKNYSHLDLEKECWYRTDLKRNNTLSREERAAALAKYKAYAEKLKIKN